MSLFYNQAALSYRGVTVASNIVTGEITQALSVSKYSLDVSYLPDQILTYVVSVTNNSETAYGELIMTDDLGAYEFLETSVVPLEYVEGSVRYYQNGTLQPEPAVLVAGALIISGLEVPANGNSMLIYQAKVNQYAPLGEGGSVTNTVTVSGDGVSEATAFAEVPAQTEASLSLTKTLEPAVVAENGRVNYTLFLENRGFREVGTDVILTDAFDPILSDIEVSCDGEEWQQGSQYSYDALTGEFSTVNGALTIPAAEASQNAEEGSWSLTPGISIVQISGTISSAQ